ncbi:efflux transporter outer membrane subunit [Rouxiella chamberiensis]|uniref:Efflux transporter outer membrane subunit n=1 Tax=Rouxiella chamberiensis TaxID=1513468 RepID=A0ABY7HQS6_9GAMM|nr:efflux transporter outer membrane subunit [Rouxiella chamberiensis]WAT01211.1 efflux transporter outer membrane subunit [Rouxiella chamberiensis]
MNKPRFALPLFSALTLTVLAGCTMEPKYDRPALPVASDWTTSKGVDAGKVQDIGWSQFFNQPDMKQVITLALANNRDLRVAALNVDTARATFQIDRAALLPTLNATGGETATHLPGGLYSTQSTGPVTYQQYSAGVGVSAYELDLFGRVRSLRDQGLETYLATEATQRATQISLVSQVAEGYLSLAADNDLLKLAIDTANSQNNSYELTKRSYDQGVSNSQDLAQAETTVRSAQADIAQYTRQVRQDVNALTLLVGTQIPQNLLQNASLNNNWNFPATPAGLPSDLLTRRPDIIAAEHTLKAANANIGAARAAFFPSITLTGSAGSESGSLSRLFDGGTGAWSFGPSINIPIFDGGVNSANLDIANTRKKIEIANYEKAIQTAFKEVSDGLAGQATYGNQLKSVQQANDANQRNFDLSQQRFKGGVDSYLSVLVAQRSLYSAQQTLISTKLAQLNSDITLFKALGGGWKK